MKNKDIEVINKLEGKPVNIYLNDETIILEKLFEKKYNKKPNRSRIYKEYLKKQLSEELLQEARSIDKKICTCCEKDYSLTDQEMYLCNDKVNSKTCVVCAECVEK